MGLMLCGTYHSWDLSFVGLIIRGTYPSWDLSFVGLIIRGTYYSWDLLFGTYYSGLIIRDLLFGTYNSGTYNSRTYNSCHRFWEQIHWSCLYHHLQVSTTNFSIVCRMIVSALASLGILMVNLRLESIQTLSVTTPSRNMSFVGFGWADLRRIGVEGVILLRRFPHIHNFTAHVHCFNAETQ